MGDTFREMLRGGFHPSETTVADGKLKSVKQNNTLGFLNGIINHYLPPTGLPLMSAQRLLMLCY